MSFGGASSGCMRCPPLGGGLVRFELRGRGAGEVLRRVLRPTQEPVENKKKDEKGEGPQLLQLLSPSYFEGGGGSP